MKNVLIIGSGKRVQSTIIPALMCLRDDFNISHIYSRSEKTIKCSLDYEIETKTQLSDIDVASIDLIMVAITLDQVPSVLKKLLKYNTQHIVLMLDTPVLRFRDIYSVRYFKNFKKVLVLEDTIALPPFVVARDLIVKNNIGKLTSIDFIHNGYKYHALASLKMLVGNNKIISIKNRKLANKTQVKEILFPQEIMTSLLEPRDYSKGKFIIHGESGSIADYEVQGMNLYKIGYLSQNGLYMGLSLNGEDILPNTIDKKYQQYISNNLIDQSLMNSMKIRGLMDLITSFDKPTSPFHYAPDEAIYDALAIKISERGYFKNIGIKAIIKLIMGKSLF